MSKKKETTSSAATQISKTYGKVISSGNELLESKKNLKVLEVSPSMDQGLNGGLLEGSWTTIAGPPKSGKAQPVDSIVYTPTGPKRIGDISIGDIVCTPDGKTAVVNGVFPQGLVPTYCVSFNDGSSTMCCGDHLWKVMKCDREHQKYFIKSTIELQKDLYFNDRYKWGIDLVQPVYFDQQEVLIDSYFLGLLLGDGGLTGGSIIYSSIDQELINYVSNYITQFDCTLKKADNRCSYRISSSLSINKIKRVLREYKLLGLNSHDKFIPKEYKYNSIEIRLGIIQGLVDTDGSIHNGHLEYSSVSKQLIEGFSEICQSLGYTVKIKTRKTKCNGKIFSSYRAHVNGNDISLLTRLSRKKHQAKIRTKKPLKRKITDIIRVGVMDSVCISIDHPEHLYITNDFIITHNTSTVLQICANAQKEGRKIVYLDGENRLKAYNLEGIEGLDKENIEIIHSPEDRQLAAEDYLTIAELLYKQPEYKGCVIVIDSTSSLLPRSELDAEVSGTIRANFPKLMAHWIKKNAQSIVNQKVVIILITHYVTNTSGYGKTKLADGGLYMQYQADTQLELMKSEPWEEEGQKIGIMCYWKIATSSMGASDRLVTTFFRFGLGIDKVQEIINIGVELGLIDKSGAWYTCTFMSDEPNYNEKDYKTQGMAKLYTLIKDNPNIYSVLESKVKTLLK